MTPQPNLAVGRTRRNIEELKALARDCGWRLGSRNDDLDFYAHPACPGEGLEIPRWDGPSFEWFAERYDAALARLTPQPGPLPSRGQARQLIAAVTAQNAETARNMCHWVQDAGRARESTHEDFHGWGNPCPFEVVAAVLTGQPDPRDAPPLSLAARRIASVLEAIKVGREHGCTTFDMTNLTRMLTEDEPPVPPVAAQPGDPDGDPFTAVEPE